MTLEQSSDLRALAVAKRAHTSGDPINFDHYSSSESFAFRIPFDYVKQLPREF
jgi:hypothetical protein